MTGVHIYNTAVSRRQYTKQANQSTCERISQGVSVHALSTLDSLSANRLSVYLQPELSLLPKASGPSARRVSADLEHQMTTSFNTADRTRFDAFDTQNGLVSNEKSQDGGANLTHLTDLTSNRRGCTWRASAGARAAALGLVDTPPSVGVKSVKSVKSPTPSCDSSFTFGVKPGVNLTPSAVPGWYNE